MAMPAARVYFDFVDPVSYLLSLEPSIRGNAAIGIAWSGFELLPPPTPLTTTDDPLWEDRWRRARARAPGRAPTLRPSRLVPWTRKAHELHAFARARGVADVVRAAIFEAYFTEGRDIGRIDVLVDVAVAAGLERTESKAALDVDRHEAEVASARAEAQELGVRDVPTLWVDGRLVEGFPDPALLGTLLPDR
jgi:predicted DsbA family dithiol-disulfide isomerase